MTSFKYHSYLLFTLLLLSACSQQITTPPPIQKNAAPIPNTWTITAKLGVRTENDSGSVTLLWQQQGPQYRIRISGPLGQGNGLLSGDDQHIVIERPNQDTLFSNNPSQLIEETFGWELPLQHLQYWIRGLNTPLLETTRQDHESSGALSNLHQDGWHLQYARYKPSGKWLMPGRIRAEKEGLVLTLIIKQWNFPKQKTPSPQQ